METKNIVTFILVQIIQVALFESGRKTQVKVECGREMNDQANITYVGEASHVYSVFNEFVCKAVTDGITHVLYNVNNNPECGATWSNDSFSFSLTIRAQIHPVLVTTEDKIYSVTCYYNQETVSSRKIHFEVYEETRRVRTQNRAPFAATIHDSFQVILKDSRRNEDLQSVITSGDLIYISIGNLTWNKDILQRMYVDRCSFLDSQSANTFSMEIVSLGCGTGVLLEKNESFALTSEGNGLESPNFFCPTFPDVYQYVVVSCAVNIVSSPLTAKQCTTYDARDRSRHQQGTELLQLSQPHKFDSLQVADTVNKSDPMASMTTLSILRGTSVKYRVRNNKITDLKKKTIHVAKVSSHNLNNGNTGYLVITIYVLSAILMTSLCVNLVTCRLMLKKKVGSGGSYNLHVELLSHQRGKDPCEQYSATTKM